MATRSILIPPLLGVVCLLGACGPTTAGLKARAEARERLALVNAVLGYDQAQQAFSVGDFDKALRAIGAALELSPEQSRYHVLQGRIYLETHRLDKAIESFDTAMERDEEAAEPHYYAGIVYQRWSDDAKAYEHYMAARELDGNAVGYLLAAGESLIALGHYEQTRRLIEAKLTYFEHNSALRHLLGQIALLQNDPAAAATLYADAWRFNPEDHMLLEDLAHAQYAAGMYEACLKSVKQLREMQPQKRAELLHFEARCLSFMERLEDARGIYLELVRQRPRDPEIWIDLGTVAWELGDFHRVALSGARINALAPDRYEGYLFKGINERHHGNREEAVALLREAADHSPDSALPHLVLGLTLEEVGDREGALGAYGKALRIDPQSADPDALFGGELNEDSQSPDSRLVTVPPPQQPDE